MNPTEHPRCNATTHPTEPSLDPLSKDALSIAVSRVVFDRVVRYAPRWCPTLDNCSGVWIDAWLVLPDGIPVPPWAHDARLAVALIEAVYPAVDAIITYDGAWCVECGGNAFEHADTVAEAVCKAVLTLYALYPSLVPLASMPTAGR